MTQIIECGGCFHETEGYTKKELVEEGWSFHQIPASQLKPAKSFPLCDTCTAKYQPRWEKAAA